MPEEIGAKETPGILKYRTYSNRGNVNEFYFLRYEDCLDRMVEAMQRKEGEDDTEEESEFKKRLIALYWSIILPRKATLGGKFFQSATFENMAKLTQISEIPLSECIEQLKAIGQYMFDMGVLKVENPNPDPRHILVTKMEPRRSHHGTL